MKIATINKIRKKIFVCLFFVLSQNIYALEITNKGIEALLKQEYNRGFEYCWNLSAIGSMTLLDQLNLRGGGYVGKLGEATDITAFFNVSTNPFTQKAHRLGFKMLYTYNDLPTYDVHSHSIVPVAKYDFQRWGATLGPYFRFTSFFAEPTIFEMSFAYSLYFDIVNNEKWCLRLTTGNYTEFAAKTALIFGASLSLNSEIYLANNLSILNEIQLFQNGNEAWTTNFYGIAWRGGVKYLW